MTMVTFSVIMITLVVSAKNLFNVLDDMSADR